jgi:hypothetical protein
MKHYPGQPSKKAWRENGFNIIEIEPSDTDEVTSPDDDTDFLWVDVPVEEIPEAAARDFEAQERADQEGRQA